MKLFSFSVLVAGVVLLDGCRSAESGSATAADGCVGPNCQAAAGAKGDYDLVVITGSGGAVGSTSATATAETNGCGLFAVGCNPDDEAACAHAVITVDTGSGGGGSGGATFSNTGAVSGAGVSSAGATATVDAGRTTLACRILRDNSVTLSQCELAGSGVTGNPCVGRINCAPGYACADDNGTAQCRRYCCGGNSVCPSGTYCEEREVKEEVEQAATLMVPVCVPSANCRFDDPYPCPAEQTCSCPSGRICGVVRADGTTACIEPGTGLEGGACPCAAGYVCSDVLGTCVKTCSLLNVADNAEQCSLGVCQASTSLPPDVGICVSSVTLQ